jgi:DNA-binding MarR family transcriptional regulator
LIKRVRSVEDRRGSYGVLPTEGENQLREAWPIYARGIKQHFISPLSEEDIGHLSAAFEKIKNT